MPTNLDTLRRVYLAADAVPALFPPVDDDLSREAGMNGYLARLLQAARDLDAAETPTPAPTAHTPEPWSIMHGGGDTYLTVSDDNLGLIAAVPLRGHYPADANAARIVAAVNACAGIADPAAAIAAARRVLEDLIQSYGECAFGAWRALELLGEE